MKYHEAEVSSFQSIANADGAGIQIDMLIDRADNCINLCEMKFYNDELNFTKEDAEKLRKRRARFQQISKTKKTIFNTIITTYGINHNQHSLGQVDNLVTMEELFLLESFE